MRGLDLLLAVSGNSVFLVLEKGETVRHEATYVEIMYQRLDP